MKNEKQKRLQSAINETTLKIFIPGRITAWFSMNRLNEMKTGHDQSHFHYFHD